MPGDASAYADDWLRIATKDWERAERTLAQGDPELAGFCLQQAIEKFLKAFLLARGWQLRRIHDLEALLDDAVVSDPSLETFRPLCRRVTAYYMLERYPAIGQTGLTSDEASNSIAGARGLVDKLRTKPLQAPPP